MEKLYIVMGITEDIGQKVIGGNFESSYDKNPVYAFKSRSAADAFIESQKLKKPQTRRAFQGDAYFKGGFYEMEVEEVELYS